ncbi:MAG: hypothetical protein KAW45_01600 [Thermoplasmatales archaeon]|nr:hypothetical protein [Thermoplasmatales archaeon]
MKKKSKIIFLTAIIAMLINLPATYVVSSTNSDYPLQPDDIEILDALEYLMDQQSEDGDISGLAVSAWAAMAIAAADEDPHEWGDLVNYLEEKANLLDPDKATDWERHTLAIAACDENPRNFGGINFVEKIHSYYDGSQIAGNVYLYDDVFGVLALISAGVNKDSEIIQSICEYIIGEESEEGGWDGIDATSVAVMALISAGKDPGSEIIQDAISFIKTQQDDSGGFEYWGTANSASTSWAINAIVAAGEDPTSTEWQKNGNSPIDFLIDLQKEDGSFDYAPGQSINPTWMTSYVIPALLGKPYPVKIYESGENNPPDTPTKPSGQTSGYTGVSYTYSTSANDPDYNQIQYRFDWDANGDHDYSSWTTLDTSGHIGSLSHSWSKAGTYVVKAQAKDEHGETSSWSSGTTVKIDKKSVSIIDEWTGSIRIEGKDNTVWDGTVTVNETYFCAKNVDTGEPEEYHIPFPSVLGAFVEAADIAGFSYLIEYWPSWDAFLVKTVEEDSDWWHYLVDYEIPMVGADKYELTDEDDEILFGYLENWEVHALKISVDKSEVTRNEEFTVHVSDESDTAVEGATVYVGSQSYTTDENGNVTASIGTGGTFTVYAEKTDFLRSEKVGITVKKNIRLTKPNDEGFYLFNREFKFELKKTWVIGAINIEVEVDESIEKIDFYINDELKYTDSIRPFEYKLNERAFFKKVTIMVKSYTINTVNYETSINNIMNILEKIKSITDVNEISNYIDTMISYFKTIKTPVLEEGDIDTQEIIMINLFPNIHK